MQSHAIDRAGAGAHHQQQHDTGLFRTDGSIGKSSSICRIGFFHLFFPSYSLALAPALTLRPLLFAYIL